MDLWYRLKGAAEREASALAVGDHPAWEEACDEVSRLIAAIGETGETPPPDMSLEDVVTPLRAARQESAARAVRLLLLLRRGAAARSRRTPAFFDRQA